MWQKVFQRKQEKTVKVYKHFIAYTQRVRYVSIAAHLRNTPTFAHAPLLVSFAAPLTKSYDRQIIVHKMSL